MQNIIKKLGKFWIFVIVYSVLVLALNLLSISKGFCDFYTDNIFWLSSAVYSRITGLFPFSVGEVLIALVVFLVLAAVVLLLLLIGLRKKTGFVKFVRNYYKSLLVLGITVAFIMTVNCSIPYNCSRLEFNGNGNKAYSAEDMVALRNYVVENCNELAKQVPRDENGNLVCPEKLNEKIIDALHSISGEFPRMKGYFPNAKAMMGSKFMYQTGMLGVYFPFTMEANYNKYVSAPYTASTIAHELSHLKGYMFEDEANFMSYIACIASDDITVRYSGYLSVLDYVDSDARWVYAQSGLMEQMDYEEFCKGVTVDEQVWNDDRCYTEQTRKELENSDFLIDTEVMEELGDKFTSSYLDYYNVEANYEEVTALLLQYYDGKLYN